MIGIASNSDTKAMMIFIKLHLKDSENWRRQRLQMPQITLFTAHCSELTVQVTNYDLTLEKETYILLLLLLLL